MKLIAYMTSRSISPEALAGLIGDVSVSGVIKWMRDERVPRPEQMRRIHSITDGQVTPNDFVLGAADEVSADIATLPNVQLVEGSAPSTGAPLRSELVTALNRRVSRGAE